MASEVQSQPVAEDEEFSFKYVPVKDFKRIVKSVRRQREKKREEARWEKVMRLHDQREEEVLARQAVNLSPASFGEYVPQEIEDEVYEDEDYVDEEIEEIPVLKGRVIQSVPTVSLESAPSINSQLNTCEILSLQEAITEDHIEAPDIPIQFVQQSHRSYVRKVEEPCLTSRTWQSDKVSTAGANEDVARIEEQFSRMKISLANVMTSIGNYTDDGLASDEEAMARVRKRALEFAARFTRNYLCELRRQTTEMKRGRTGRLSSSVQTATQAVVAIERASPGIFLDGVPPCVHDFLSELLQLSHYANDCCCQGNSHVIQEVEDLSSMLDSLLLDFSPQKEKKKKKKPEKRPIPPTPKKKKKKDDYFMYRTNLNCFERAWKRRTQSLARAKFGQVPSADAKHLPKSAPKGLPATGGETAMGTRSREPKMAARSRPRRITTAIKESEVTTMMDTLSPVEGEDGVEDKRQNSQCRSQPIYPAPNNRQKDDLVPVVDDAVKSMLTDIMSEVLQQASAPNGLPRKLLDRLTSSVPNMAPNVSLVCVVEDEARAEVQRRIRNHQLRIDH